MRKCIFARLFALLEMDKCCSQHVITHDVLPKRFTNLFAHQGGIVENIMWRQYMDTDDVTQLAGSAFEYMCVVEPCLEAMDKLHKLNTGNMDRKFSNAISVFNGLNRLLVVGCYTNRLDIDCFYKLEMPFYCTGWNAGNVDLMRRKFFKSFNTDSKAIFETDIDWEAHNLSESEDNDTDMESEDDTDVA